MLGQRGWQLGICLFRVLARAQTTPTQLRCNWQMRSFIVKHTAYIGTACKNLLHVKISYTQISLTCKFYLHLIMTTPTSHHSVLLQLIVWGYRGCGECFVKAKTIMAMEDVAHPLSGQPSRFATWTDAKTWLELDMCPNSAIC